MEFEWEYESFNVIFAWWYLYPAMLDTAFRIIKMPQNFHIVAEQIGSRLHIRHSLICSLEFVHSIVISSKSLTLSYRLQPTALYYYIIGIW